MGSGSTAKNGLLGFLDLIPMSVHVCLGGGGVGGSPLDQPAMLLAPAGRRA